MRDFVFGLFVFAFSSSIVLATILLHIPVRSIHQFLAVLVMSILVLVNLLYRKKMRVYGSWVLLFLAALTVQLLVASTGGLSSPFFILFYLAAIGIILFFSLNVSILFLAFSFWVLLGNILFDPQSKALFQHDPVAMLLYGVSFLAVIPIAQLFAQKYKFKDKIMTMMTNQIEVEESIIEELYELIFVTDKDGVILSVNDAVVQTLRLSRSELVNHSLFSVIFLKDKDGKKITKDALALDKILKENTTKNFSGISLLAASTLTSKHVSMRVKPVISLTGEVDQISFIISTTTQVTKDPHKSLAEAITRHDGMIEEMKKRLIAKKSPELHKFLLIAKSEKDILIARTLGDHGIEEKKVLVDVAALCKQAVVAEQIFAQGLHVDLKFQLKNFGEEDIAPLVTSQFSIKPDQLTGPFFTAPSAVTHTNIVLQKLLETAILLASSEKDPAVELSIEREGETALLITITADAPKFSEEDHYELFLMYYGSLAQKTDIDLGSGLEGYLAKKIADILGLPLQVKRQQDGKMTFELRINKEKNSSLTD